MIRERFGRQLASLREDLLRLGSRVEHAMHHAIKSMETWNTTLASQVIDDDLQIDEAQRHAEEEVIKLIATQQPVASDLRLLGVVFAIASELERIGDYACSIARRLQRATRRPMLVVPPAGIYEMATLAQKMLNISLEAFLRQDSEMVRSLAELDEHVDQLEDKLREELIAIARNDPQRLEAVLDLLDVVHALERAADRATNIGERIIYLETSIMEELNP
ncbi:MAG: phosphate signaling complex protein PhoU [Chloroflexaceae bacterium]|nr:phosphate signaling complex protein PhoU [Chloroflexaceae bacterium]